MRRHVVTLVPDRADWLPGAVAGGGAVDITQLSQTETVSS